MHARRCGTTLHPCGMYRAARLILSVSTVPSSLPRCVFTSARRTVLATLHLVACPCVSRLNRYHRDLESLLCWTRSYQSVLGSMAISQTPLRTSSYESYIKLVSFLYSVIPLPIASQATPRNSRTIRFTLSCPALALRSSIHPFFPLESPTDRSIVPLSRLLEASLHFLSFRSREGASRDSPHSCTPLSPSR